MPIAIKMPALSPTMEEGTLAKWLVKVGDKVSSGDIMAEIETDKATMEFEAVDEGTIVSIDIAEGSEGVKVGTIIAQLAEEGEDASAAPAPKAEAPAAPASVVPPTPKPAQAEPVEAPAASAAPAPKAATAAPAGDRIIASPLAKRIAADKGIDLSTIKGTGPGGRIVKADLDAPQPAAAAPAAAPAASAAAAPAPSAPAALPDFGIPHEDAKLNNIRKVIARRLTEAKQTIPHIYLTVDVKLDALLKLRGELNAALASQGVKLSVNDLLIKALAKALVQVPKCNVSFGGDVLRSFSRADISVAVAAPSGLITPIIVDAGSKSVSAIATEM